MNLNPLNMPPAMQAVVALGTGAGLLGALALVFHPSPMFYVIIALGIVVVALLLLAYRFLLKMMLKRKSAPLERGLADNSAATPQGISEPARRARLDDLRRNFDTGVEKFRAAGKNLYSVPWYVLVGEPGSGKTEAIRHSNVGFPPGLQDQLQGAGGTLNMNWWFTSHSVILDTAGRMMFEEVSAGKTNEWQEFLKLLKVARPTCPINGMLLVIPVDTLIKDSADQIESKASKIAQQFDSIQRALGVRFPVFIVITKCDLLNGFREFFDDLNDPQLQHQMLGWSNPNPLDERFDPSQVDAHLGTVAQRLAERRQRLMLDPVNTEDPSGRRIEQVDALYALPESITRIGPRLRRYLEMIFVAGEWSPKPLFLRGIYFTSSMTEGSALDADLAEVLGMPVDQLPEGRIWQRDRAFFLRDLFIDKVFKEKGLVTRAGNADKQIRQRKLVLLAASFAAVLVLALVTFLGFRQLQSSVGVHRDLWTRLEAKDPSLARIIKTTDSGTYRWAGNDEFDKDSPTLQTPLDFFGKNLALVRAGIRVPLIFRPVAAFGTNVNLDRRNAYRTLYEQAVLAPLVQAARVNLRHQTADNWTAEATAALVQLERLEVAAVTKGSATPDIAALIHYALPPAELAKVKPEDVAQLQDAANWLYGEGGDKLGLARLNAGNADSADVVKDGVVKAMASWSQPIDRMKSALVAFDSADADLLKLKGNVPETAAAYTRFIETWTSRQERVRAAGEQVDLVLAAVARLGGGSAGGGNELGDATASAAKSLTALRDALPEKLDGDVGQTLVALRKDLDGTLEKLKNVNTGDLGTLDRNYLGSLNGPDGKPHRRFQVAMTLYQTAGKLLPAALDKPLSADAPAAQLAAVDTDLKQASAAVDAVVNQIGKDDSMGNTCALTLDALQAAGRARRYVVVAAYFAATPSTRDGWVDYVKARAAHGADMQRPKLPLITASDFFQDGYDTTAVAAIFATNDAVSGALQASGGITILDRDQLAARAALLGPAFKDYLLAYSTYWQRGALDELKFGGGEWAAYHKQLVDLFERDIRSPLREYGEKMAAALDKIGAAPEATNIRAQLLTLDKPDFQDECSAVLKAWRSLSDDPRQARRAILALSRDDVMRNYVVLSTRRDDGVVGTYWNNFAVESLNVLALSAQKGVRAALDELASYNKFPLAPLTDPAQQLTPAQVAQARDTLRNILGDLDPSATPTRPASEGARGERTLDAKLELLRGTDQLKGKEAYLKALRNLLSALPEADRTESCAVSVIKARLKSDDSVSYPYAHMVILQGNRRLGTADLRNADADTLDKLQVPADAITLGFRKSPTEPENQIDNRVAIPGPWAALELLHQYKGQRDEKNPRAWDVQVPVKDPDDGKTYVVWLHLEFELPLPALADWPQAPQ